MKPLRYLEEITTMDEAMWQRMRDSIRDNPPADGAFISTQIRPTWVQQCTDPVMLKGAEDLTRKLREIARERGKRAGA